MLWKRINLALVGLGCLGIPTPFFRQVYGALFVFAIQNKHFSPTLGSHSGNASSAMQNIKCVVVG